MLFSSFFRISILYFFIRLGKSTPKLPDDKMEDDNDDNGIFGLSLGKNLNNFATFSPIFTARVAKRAKVMFSQACVTSTLGGGGGRGAQHQWSTTSLPPSLPPGPGHNTSLPPHTRTRSQHLPLPPPGTMRRRAVRILLECILVSICCRSFGELDKYYTQ